jgi:hypothetical protein
MVTATTAVMTMATTVSSVLPTPASVGVNQVAVVEILEDNAPPPGWGQWENLPAPALEHPAGVLMMREDACVMSGRPTHDAEASSSRAALPASDGIAAHLEQERVDTPPAHFSDAQAEQALWQEFRDHSSSVNRALDEVLRIHGGPAWRICQVRGFSPGFEVSPLSFLARLCFP